MKVVNLAKKFALFSDHWRPRIVGRLNGQQVKLALHTGNVANERTVTDLPRL